MGTRAQGSEIAAIRISAGIGLPTSGIAAGDAVNPSLGAPAAASMRRTAPARDPGSWDPRRCQVPVVAAISLPRALVTILLGAAADPRRPCIGFTQSAPSGYNAALPFAPGRPMLRILEEALTFDDVLLVPA